MFSPSQDADQEYGRWIYVNLEKQVLPEIVWPRHLAAITLAPALGQEHPDLRLTLGMSQLLGDLIIVTSSVPWVFCSCWNQCLMHPCLVSVNDNQERFSLPLSLKRLSPTHIFHPEPRSGQSTYILHHTGWSPPYHWQHGALLGVCRNARGPSTPQGHWRWLRKPYLAFSLPNHAGLPSFPWYGCPPGWSRASWRQSLPRAPNAPWVQSPWPGHLLN